MSGAAGRQARNDRSFDEANWPPSRVRLGFAAIALAFAVTLWLTGGRWRIGAVLALADTAVALLPWRYPRSGRGTLSIWAEVLGYQAGPVAMAVVAVPWLARVPAPLWWPAGVAAGALLIGIGGLPLRALLSGDLAALAAPVSLRHKAARCFSTAVGPPGEEAMYRVPLLVSHGAVLALASIASAASFIGRHHLAPGLHARTTPRMLAAQLTAAIGFTGLTLASRSVYPALIAHLLNNAPGLLLEAGRTTTKPKAHQEAVHA